MLAPVVTLLWLALGADFTHWAHLAQFVLPQAALNTALLLAGVGTLVLVIGTGCAWLVTSCDFPLRRVLHWALLLPLAMPTYIVAFAYLDLLHPIGPVQGALRWLLGFDSPREFRLPDLRSMPGAIFVLGFVLYPYVYMTARAMFMTQPAHLLEAARTLGESRWGAFRRVALPLARPALAVGLSLALLETLNDIGASEFLGVNTLTVAVYTTWITRSDLAGAAQIACAMLFAVVALVMLERHGRRHQRFGSDAAHAGAAAAPPARGRGLGRDGGGGAAGADRLRRAGGLPGVRNRAAPGRTAAASRAAWSPAWATRWAWRGGVTAVAVAAGLVVAWTDAPRRRHAATARAGRRASPRWATRCPARCWPSACSRRRWPSTRGWPVCSACTDCR